MLSIIILTHNDEGIIADTLDSVQGFGNELIVVDSQSKDRTPEIAKHMGAKVFNHEFSNFAEQRNFALTKASGDWVLYLDSDERATPAFKKEVLKTIQEYTVEERVAGFYINRKTYYYGKDWNMTDRVQRLFRKSQLKTWKGKVHETPHVDGKILEIESPVHHYTHRNLSHMVEKTNEWSEFEAQSRYESKHPVMTSLRFIRVMLTGFFQSYIKDKGYKNGTEGFIEAIYQAFSMFITYAKLWEKQQKKQ